MVLDISPQLVITAASTAGLKSIQAGAIVLAMGCRERTAGAIAVNGYRPAGVYTAGMAQRMMNMEGYRLGREVVIYGSGDIGLIMARRMTLEGAKVKAVVEIMPISSGLNRNIAQCLVYYPCDTLLLSVGLIPENELSQKAGVPLDQVTNGPIVDSTMQTEIPGIFACGNVLHVHDIVDFVTRESRIAGKNAGLYALGARNTSAIIPCVPGTGIRYVMPQKIITGNPDGANLFMRTDTVYEHAAILVHAGKTILAKKCISRMIPSEMINIPLRAEQLSHLKEPVSIAVI